MKANAVQEGRCSMGTDDKIQNSGEDLMGKGKEAMGRATDDKSMEAEGQNDQSKASIKKAAENVKDAFK